ncbi:PilZ domain-containing protein [Sphingomonas bacterium]|uniref:PilZ domain-containing protein n=1 Tax=Sphingomonas bacterium TaxID=1895847 RepID=UPI0015767589|nr:PilZ domain-containing protein [Sphingomonas bacterium]
MEQPRFTPPFTPLTDSDDSRRALRKAVKVRAHLRDRGQTKFEIGVVDLSESGFRAETSFTLWPGTVVWLTLPGLAPLEAVVAWRDKASYGCAFAKKLHPAVFEHIVALGNR